MPRAALSSTVAQLKDGEAAASLIRRSALSHVGIVAIVLVPKLLFTSFSDFGNSNIGQLPCEPWSKESLVALS